MNQAEIRKVIIPKMNLWLLMITIIILFGVLSAAFIVSVNYESESSKIEIPPIFYLNTLILMISSYFIHQAWQHDQKKKRALFLLATVGSGILFLVCQLYGWSLMYDAGLFIQAEDRKVVFLYLLSGLHAAHILAGLSFLIFIATNISVKAPKYIELGAYFWHFLGILWIYLLAVLFLTA